MSACETELRREILQLQEDVRAARKNDHFLKCLNRTQNQHLTDVHTVLNQGRTYLEILLSKQQFQSSVAFESDKISLLTNIQNRLENMLHLEIAGLQQRYPQVINRLSGDMDIVAQHRIICEAVIYSIRNAKDMEDLTFQQRKLMENKKKHALNLLNDIRGTIDLEQDSPELEFDLQWEQSLEPFYPPAMEIPATLGSPFNPTA